MSVSETLWVASWPWHSLLSLRTLCFYLQTSKAAITFEPGLSSSLLVTDFHRCACPLCLASVGQYSTALLPQLRTSCSHTGKQSCCSDSTISPPLAHNLDVFLLFLLEVLLLLLTLGKVFLTLNASGSNGGDRELWPLQAGRPVLLLLWSLPKSSGALHIPSQMNSVRPWFFPFVWWRN